MRSQLAINFSRPCRQILLLDVMMPHMDGFEVCGMIKKTDNVAVIMLTAKDEIDDRG